MWALGTTFVSFTLILIAAFVVGFIYRKSILGRSEDYRIVLDAQVRAETKDKNRQEIQEKYN